MDPSACSICGRWIRRCKCSANGGANASAAVESVESSQRTSDMFGSLPHDVALLLWTRCSLSALGCLACTSKQLRQGLYTREVWEALRKTWAGGPLDEPPAGVSPRWAVRAAIEIERRWRAPGSWTQSALPLHRCRANEKMGEVLGADLLSDGRRVVVSGRMPAVLQVWSLARSSSHMLTHCLRGRTYVNGLEPRSPTLLCPQLCLPTGDGERVATFHRCDLFYSLLLPPLPGSASGGRALSQDVRRTKAVLWLWNDVPAAGHAAAAAAPQKLLLAGSSSRVLSCAVCAATSILACTDEEGNVYLFAIGAPTAALIGCHRVGSPLECLRMTLGEASLVLLCGARDGTIKLLLRSNDGDASASPASPLGIATREANPLLSEPAAEGDVSLAKAPPLEALPLPPPPPALALLAESTTPGHSDWVTQIALRPQHSDRKADVKGTAREEGMGLFCSASRDHSVRVWHVDVERHVERGTAPSIRAHCLHVLHGHARWVTGLAMGAARAHLCSPADPIGAHGHPLTTADVECVPIPFVVSASADGTLRVWRLTDGVCLGVLEGHTRSVTDLDLRGARVLSASMDGTIRCWELAPLLCDQLTSSRRPDANAVAPYVPAAQGQEGNVARDVERIHRVSHHLCMRGHEDFVRTCRFDQRRVVSASDDNKVLVWAFDSAVMP